jgi:mono/diheme cytochrome c family protein
MAAFACFATPATGQDAVPADKALPKIWNGVFTTAQVERGKDLFHARCAHCHSEDLTGGEGPSLVGGSFGRNWGSRHVDRLFTKIKEKMPPGEEFLVTDLEKVDIVTFILSMNGFPSGDTDLALDPAFMADLQIVGRNGPEPPPTGAMVEVLGCLVPNGTSWKLTHSIEPAISTMDDVAADAKDAVSRPLGSHTIQLLDVFPKPDAHEGHRMMVKGLLIRLDDQVKVNVLAIGMVSSSCP